MPRCRSCNAFVPDAAAERCPGCGAPVDGPGDDWEREVRSLVDDGRKIEAIKVYREKTGVGLAEAKAAVEGIVAGASRPAAEPDDDLEADVLRRLRQDGKIEAVKFYREQTGMGLAESRRAVEAIETAHRLTPKRSGCLGALAALAIAAVAIGMMIW